MANIKKRIRVLRGQFVLLDVDVADLYGVSSEQLGELVRRNQAIFSDEFAFVIGPDEVRQAKLAVAALAFTEHGVILAATMLNTPSAVEMSIRVVRSFVKLREEAPAATDLVRRIESLERAVAAFDRGTREQFEKILRTIDRLAAQPASSVRSDRELH